MNRLRTIIARYSLWAFSTIALIAGCAGTSDRGDSGVQRLYVLYCLSLIHI